MTLTEPQEKRLLLLLAGMQFTNLLDFVIMMPLGATFIDEFRITPQAFGALVSSYSISAAVTGILAALVIDRFDRRFALLLTYGGFTLGTLFCALAQSYHALLLARVFAGAFGGILGALILSVVGEVIPEQRRGKAVGIVMAAFSVATVAGVPAGILLNELADWHVPFYAIAVLGALFWIVIWKQMPSLKAHMTIRAGGLWHQLKTLWFTAFFGPHLRAMTFTILLMFAGFTVIPYIAPYLTKNVGLERKYLALVYFFGGLTTMFSSRYAGVLADRYGKHKVFSLIALLSLMPILVLTHLPVVPLWMIIVVTTVFMILVNGRFVPAMALVTGSARAHDRGAFMSINSSIQHLFAGVAAAVAGTLVQKMPDESLAHYDHVGYFASIMTLVAIAWCWQVRAPAPEREKS